jgi:hypothetical protein
MPITILEVSAKSGLNVAEAFQFIMKQSLQSPAKLLSVSASTSAATSLSSKSAENSSVSEP